MPVDFIEFGPALAVLQEEGADAVKSAIRLWKNHVVLPAAERYEHAWFQRQVSTSLGMSCLPPLLKGLPSEVMTAARSVVWPRKMLEIF